MSNKYAQHKSPELHSLGLSSASDIFPRPYFSTKPFYTKCIPNKQSRYPQSRKTLKTSPREIHRNANIHIRVSYARRQIFSPFSRHLSLHANKQQHATGPGSIIPGAQPLMFAVDTLTVRRAKIQQHLCSLISAASSGVRYLSYQRVWHRIGGKPPSWPLSPHVHQTNCCARLW